MQQGYETQYHQLEDEHFWFVARREGLAKIIQNLSLPKDAKILDIGCSSGRMLESLNHMGYQNLTGIDISPTAIERCKKNGHTDVHVMDGANPNLPPQTYDVILASDVLEHLQNEHQALANWSRLLKPGANAIIFVPAFEALWSSHDEVNHHYRRYTRRRLCNVLDDNQFQIKYSGYWNTSLFPPLAVVRPLSRIIAGVRPRRWQNGQIPPQSHGMLDNGLPKTNAFLTWLLKIENHMLTWKRSPPFGVSTYAVVEKKAA